MVWFHGTQDGKGAKSLLDTDSLLMTLFGRPGPRRACPPSSSVRETGMWEICSTGYGGRVTDSHFDEAICPRLGLTRNLLRQETSVFGLKQVRGLGQQITMSRCDPTRWIGSVGNMHKPC